MITAWKAKEIAQTTGYVHDLCKRICADIERVAGQGRTTLVRHYDEAAALAPRVEVVLRSLGFEGDVREHDGRIHVSLDWSKAEGPKVETVDP